jgi:hypothetical protein
VSHNLKPVADDDAGIAGPIAPSVRDRLIAWAKAAL